MKLLLLSYTCQALVLPPRRLAVGRPLAPRFAPPNKVAIPLEGTYAVANEQKEVPFPHTKLGIGLIVTALVLQSAGASLLARRVALRHSYDGAVAGLLQEAVKVPIGLAWLVLWRATRRLDRDSGASRGPTRTHLNMSPSSPCRRGASPRRTCSSTTRTRGCPRRSTYRYHNPKHYLRRSSPCHC